MTAQEFFEQFEPKRNIRQQFETIASMSKSDIFDLMQAYADHCEQTSWVDVKERLPELESTNCSYDVIALIYGLRPEIAFYRIDTGKWYYCLTDHEIKHPVTHWRPLLTIPKK